VPSGLVLIATPVDPLANPTRVVHLLRQHPISWFERNSLGEVHDRYEGRGRQVYPAERQLWALATYLARGIAESGELAQKVWADDGLDPSRFPFLDLYTSIMDIDAQVFLDTIRIMYQERSLCTGGLRCGRTRIEPRTINRTALMSVEGAWDDIAAPGQTSAVHALCTQLVEEQRCRLVVPRCGHFSLFHGERWRLEVQPAIEKFLLAHTTDTQPKKP
jgi:poly(3-hydroxybutyrate) depolymerase